MMYSYRYDLTPLVLPLGLHTTNIAIQPYVCITSTLQAYCSLISYGVFSFVKPVFINLALGNNLMFSVILSLTYYLS